MAPEVFSGGVASERSDVLSLAVTITAADHRGAAVVRRARRRCARGFPRCPRRSKRPRGRPRVHARTTDSDGRRAGRCAGPTAPNARRRLACAQHGRARCSAVDHRGRGSHRRRGVRCGRGLGRPDRRRQWRAGLPGGVGGGRARDRRRADAARRGRGRVGGRQRRACRRARGPRGPAFRERRGGAHRLYPEHDARRTPAPRRPHGAVCFSSSIAATAGATRRRT